MSNTQASGIDFVKRYTELRKEFNMVDALRKLQIESSSPPQEPSAKAIAEAAWDACEKYQKEFQKWAINISLNPVPTAPNKEQYLKSLK